jgi:hypothetical protein
MLCGIGIYYGTALLASEELAKLGWQAHDYQQSMRYIIRAARIMPFDHRLREYPIMRTAKELRHEPNKPQ